MDMEEAKKRKLEEGGILPVVSLEELRSLLDPLPKTQLVDLLARVGSLNPSIAEEIKNVASADPALRKLFVRGLAWNTSSETLCAAFEEHGEIEEGAVIFDKATGKSRGYGFITYKDMESAQRALRAPSKMIDGRMSVCNLASESINSNTSITCDQSQRKLYIGGLSPDTTSEMLLDFFRRHGEIEEGSVAYDKDTEKSRGFGFVTYKNTESAKKALENPQRILGGRNVTVKLADNYKGKFTAQVQTSAALVTTPFLTTPPGYHSHAQQKPPHGFETHLSGYTYHSGTHMVPQPSYPMQPPPYPPYYMPTQ
ncbi:unnamed protein product [Cuscuta europaea]|uniref:RRM domain-containing protein n=2 Tax=Cuscuta europaea TaxID=41803 RepID=A0A9P0ZWR7_CUSEU|nr:unnamed protein product [Cuscuta europaea]